MKRIVFLLSVLVLFVFVGHAVNIPGNQNFTGEVNIEGDFKLKGKKVTATADGLNALDALAPNIQELTNLSNNDGGSLTNLNAANIAAGSALSAVDGNAVTNLSPATAFPDYSVCIVTNVDLDGKTNVITFIGIKTILGE